MPLSQNRSPIIGALQFAVAPLISDTDIATTYGTVKEIIKNLIAAGYTPETPSQDLSASDQVILEFISKQGGAVRVTMAGLNADDENLLFGSTVNPATGLITSNVDDIIPYVMIIYSLPRGDGLINLYKIPKCKFTNKGEEGKSKTKSGITISTIDLEGKYSPTISSGDDIYCIKGVNPKSTEGEATIKTWFATASGGIT